MYEQIMITRLLEKYERSKHVTEPGASARRVMLNVDRKELPEYDYHDAALRDAFNQAARNLEKDGLLALEWVKGKPVLCRVILNLERVLSCYERVGRHHPRILAEQVVQMAEETLPEVQTPWILAWKEALCKNARTDGQVPGYCKKELGKFAHLLSALRLFDTLNGQTITMRAFSSKCYQDTKYFERNVRELFLRIALKYDPELREANENQELGVREQLAFLGIYARPEHYELAGDVSIRTGAGEISVAAAAPYGLAIPSTLVAEIESMDLSRINRVTFIENKTNYDAYILTEAAADELVVYHGGFLSPKKRAFFAKMAAGIPVQAQVAFWGDIDLGGFRMFVQLKGLIERLTPMRMSGEEVSAYWQNGLWRAEEYLDRLKNVAEQPEYRVFASAVQKILEYRVTIEQECFLL